MRAPANLPALLCRHNASLERFRRQAVKPFEARARWLLLQIKAELGLPSLSLDYCNGDHWLAPGDTRIPFRGKDGETYGHGLRHALDAHATGHDEPAVSERCRGYLKELHDLCAFSAYSQMHTIEAVYLTV